LYIYSSDNSSSGTGVYAFHNLNSGTGVYAFHNLNSGTGIYTFHNSSSRSLASCSFSEGELSIKSASSYHLRSEIVKDESVKKRIKATKVKEVSIGAGAKIKQDLISDSYPLDSWKNAPDAIMTIYFVFHEKLEELKSKGMRDLKGYSEGMLNKIPVG